ncbi:MAG: ABC transporter ATP-binding protein/permease [Erysipelotrichaceae bacterium]|jgi:ATP-binding cassette subfamily B protein|nr:ABC transporter ATP-binding protein/permease [Erysipelotrichaceae bacterium]MCI1326255.1 ABC transporter ATP-binding protein/permease [Solobacterium sp.]MCH4045374.1 ABC transporter ATP-binding protein/permease [Erysipelotrichaceae bacterium]MCH4122584.1 ABC transporter ATP-binding protein/permease [Erysipelotrichaceae bacterium]MCI1362847.1 ABC transporter ATP-binding protein/permease [Solobacterium sp.]
MEEKTEKKTKILPWFGLVRLWPYIRQFKAEIIVTMVLTIAATAIDAAWPLFNRYALNHFIGEKTMDTLWYFVAAYVGLLLFQILLNFISIYHTGRIEMTVDRDLRNDAFTHLQTLSFSFFNQNNVGYLHARVMSDTGKIGEMVAWRMMDLAWNGSYLIFIFAVMFRIQAKLALMVIVIVPLAVIAISWFQKHLLDGNRRIRELNSTITSDFNEGITGARSIKTLVIEDLMNDDFQKDTDHMFSQSVHTARYSAALISLLTMMSSLVLAIVLTKGGQLTARGLIMLGTLSVFMSYALNMVEPVQMIIETISAMISIQVNIERFVNLMETKSDVADSPAVIAKYGDTFHPRKENWEPLYGDVEFKDVSFRYPDGTEWILQHFNLKVPQGTNVAIVGETGAGKSTLVNLVCRFYEPTEGQVLIDGRDARERSQLWLHANIGYVLQQPHLFSGSIRDNLRYGKPDASDEEIWKALEAVDAADVVRRMEKGLDSDVGEGGDLLSVGEKQLLSFARALLCNPRILVLDEATSSIDTVTEKKIQNAVSKIIQGRTSFMIAHRLSTVVDADVILAVKDGKIVERGTHKQLMAEKGYYYELYTRQFASMAADLI